ncbi:MAG: hypothetical protein ACREVW_03880 [Burkholderiales bacterium]
MKPLGFQGCSPQPVLAAQLLGKLRDMPGSLRVWKDGEKQPVRRLCGDVEAG